jgi:Family of unknown function (DUF5711)
MKIRILLNIILVLVLNSKGLSQDEFRTKTSIVEKSDQQRVFHASVYNDSTRIFSIVKDLNARCSIPKAIALNNGNLALLHSLEGVLEIYDNTSQLIFEKEFYSLPPYREQNIKSTINDKGIVLLVSEEQKNRIYIIDNFGIPIGEMNIEDGLLSGLATSRNSEIVAYSIMNWNNNELKSKTTLYNIGRNHFYDLPINFDSGIFNKTADLFLGTTNKNSFCVDLNKEEILWQNKLLDDQIYLDAIFKNDDAILVQATDPKLINNKWVFENTKIVQKELSGNENILREIYDSVFKINLIMSKGKLSININDNILLLRRE